MNVRVLFIGVTLSLLLSLPCGAGKRRRAAAKPVEQGVVQLKASDYIGVETEPEGVIRILSETIRKDAKSSKFRISWSSSMAEQSWRGTALYDRKNKSIKTYSSTVTANSQSSNIHLYTNVTDEAIHKAVELIAKDTENPVASGNMYFNKLTLFGCKHRQIK